MEYEIPVVDTEVDTDEPVDSLMGVAGAVAGVVSLFGIYAGARTVYSKINAKADLADVEVPEA